MLHTSIITSVRVQPDGSWEGGYADADTGRVTSFGASPSLFLIGEAWHRGCSFEAEADGYGPGQGTHGDWSGIRDSSDEAVDVMLTKALNYLFRTLHD